METYLIITSLVIILLPIILEIVYDKWMWSKGEDDKPSSTYYRTAMFITYSFVLGIISPFGLWIGVITGLILLFTTHILVFNYALNITRPGVKLSYRKVGEWWTDHTPWYGELFFKLIFQYSAWAAYYHWDWVLGDYPSKLVEFFMF